MMLLCSAGPWPATAPTTGFSVALWYMPLSTSTSQGHLMERQVRLHGS